MQGNEQNVEEYSIEQLNNLIKEVKKARPHITDEEIANELGYNDGYISQCRSRGKVSKKFYENVQRSYLAPQKGNLSVQMQGSSSMTAKLEGVNKEQKDISILIEANLLHANNCARLITLLEEKLAPRIEPAKPGASGHKDFRKKQGTDSK